MSRARIGALWGALLFWTASAVAAHAAESPWAQITARDLHAIHDLLRDNHPGPVDPLNPGYKPLLENGLAKGLARARSVHDVHEYARTLKAYVNSFRDGHTSLLPALQPSFYEWPGFLPGVAADGAIRIGVSEAPEAAVGDRLVSCDGIAAERLFETRVAPYLWNRDIASERGLRMPYTLLIEPGDDVMRLKTCRIAAAAGERDVELQWRRSFGDEPLVLRRKADGRVAANLGLKQLNGVWLISIPSFNYQSDADVARFQAFLAEVAAHQGELRRALKIVIDVRGNGGGISTWGLEMAATLWGRDAVDAAEAPFDGESADWRASKSNLQQRESFLRNGERNGMPKRSLDDVRASRDAIAKALAAGRPLARQSGAPPGPALPMPASRLNGRVYFFTDEVCASSCLNFADVVLRLPNVTHVGRATSADALYIDVDSKPLPSGLMLLNYSMKVDRDKVRGNNQSYTPAIAWPGGAMTDEAITAWVRDLPG